MRSLTFRDVISVLEDSGFSRIRVKGSHGHYEATIGGRRMLVTVQQNHPNDTVAKGTLSAIIRQSGLGKAAFLK